LTDAVIEFEKLYLKPGELCVSKVPVLVTTILGSCVAVTMCHRKLGVAAICHATQPDCPKRFKGCPEHCERKYHYASCVIPEMVQHMKALGAKPEDLEVKLFGGAAVLITPTAQSIGKQNIEAARSSLEQFGLRPKIHQVGGHHGRKLVFNTHTGEIMLKRIRYAESLGIILQRDKHAAGG
jgi:chemotaxis protein CheD